VKDVDADGDPQVLFETGRYCEADTQTNFLFVQHWNPERQVTAQRMYAQDFELTVCPTTGNYDLPLSFKVTW
jgi:hypothetical protein